VTQITFPDPSAERHANATVLSPHDIAGIDFFLRHNDQRELVGNIALRSDVERGSFVSQITNNAAEMPCGKRAWQQNGHQAQVLGAVEAADI
jgi:hypothetical protein